jgi:hypothetical protein
MIELRAPSSFLLELPADILQFGSSFEIRTGISQSHLEFRPPTPKKKKIYKTKFPEKESHAQLISIRFMRTGGGDEPGEKGSSARHARRRQPPSPSRGRLKLCTLHQQAALEAFGRELTSMPP